MHCEEGDVEIEGLSVLGVLNDSVVESKERMCEEMRQQMKGV